MNALRNSWGEDRFSQWIANSPHNKVLAEIAAADLGAAGFPSLMSRIMEPTRIEAIESYLSELGRNLKAPAAITIGGSAALILDGLLIRRTDDINIVDEIPIQIRSQQKLLDQLAEQFALRLAVVEPQHLPAEWESRQNFLDTFDQLEVNLLDPLDIVLSKLISDRRKDLDDLRTLIRRFDQSAITKRLLDTAAAFRQEEKLRLHAEKNWYILYGEPLPE